MSIEELIQTNAPIIDLSAPWIIRDVKTPLNERTACTVTIAVPREIAEQIKAGKQAYLIVEAVPTA